MEDAEGGGVPLFDFIKPNLQTGGITPGEL